MPGPSQSERSAEAPRASRRASSRVMRRARVASNPPPKRYMSEPSGKPSGPPRTIRRSETRASRLASRWARLKPHAPPREPPRHPPRNPLSKPLPRSRVRSGAQAAARGCRRYRTEPLRLLLCESLNGGRTWKEGHWGSYSCIIIERRRRPRAPHLLRDCRET